MKPSTLYQRLKKNQDGNVTVELALIMTVLVLVIIYGYDFSQMAIEKHRLEQFARAGTQHALLSQSAATDEDEITAAINDAAGEDADDLTITLTNFCECPGAAGTANCDDECSGGDVPNLFLTVLVEKDYEYVSSLSYSVGGDITLEGTSSVRVR